MTSARGVKVLIHMIVVLGCKIIGIEKYIIDFIYLFK